MEHVNKTWKGRAEGLKGNYTSQSLNLVARYCSVEHLTIRIEFDA